jgi:hypothetical protein
MNIHRHVGFPRKTLAFFVLVLCLANFPLFSLNKSGAKQSIDINAPMSWIPGYTLILLKEGDIRSVNEAKDFIVSEGGTIAVISDCHAMLGWVPPAVADRIVGKHGIESVHYESVDTETLKYGDDITRTFVKFFNSAASGEIERQSLSPRKAGDPLIQDALEHPFVDPRSVVANLADKHVDWDADRARTADNGGIFPGYSDSMIGTIACTVFFVECNGSYDADTYPWTNDAVNLVNQQCIAGATWWSNKASYYNKTATFYLNYYPPDRTEMRQRYEPILHPSTDDGLWINLIMANLGYSSGDKLARVTAYNAYLKSYASTQWAYSCFIAFNPSPAPNTFTDGYFSYAYLGGPYVHMLYRNDGWAVTDIGRIFSHETGHIFWACDEYYQAGYGGCTSCAPCSSFRPITNGNCQHPSCNPNGSVPCIMRDNADAICSYTVQQVGWQVPSQILTIQTGAGGTTTPTPGAYTYDKGTSVSIRAVADARYQLKNWSGDASGNTNPVTITMDSDKTVKANFQRIINAPANAAGQKVLNRTLSQAEYINVLTWEANSNNSDLNIVSYKIYRIDGGTRTEIGTVAATAELKFMERKVGKDTQYTYEIVAVNNEPREGDAASVTIY